MPLRGYKKCYVGCRLTQSDRATFITLSIRYIETLLNQINTVNTFEQKLFVEVNGLMNH